MPFGHGLHYAGFSWQDLHLTGAGAAPRVSLSLTNGSERTGQEVVQVYIRPLEVRAPGKGVRRPFQELRAFAIWDTALGRFRVPAGDHEIRVGASSRDIRLTGTWTIDADLLLRDPGAGADSTAAAAG